jgi:hypothetical protein
VAVRKARGSGTHHAAAVRGDFLLFRFVCIILHLTPGGGLLQKLMQYSFFVSAFKCCLIN